MATQLQNELAGSGVGRLEGAQLGEGSRDALGEVGRIAVLAHQRLEFASLLAGTDQEAIEERSHLGRLRRKPRGGGDDSALGRR